MSENCSPRIFVSFVRYSLHYLLRHILRQRRTLRAKPATRPCRIFVLIRVIQIGSSSFRTSHMISIVADTPYFCPHLKRYARIFFSSMDGRAVSTLISALVCVVSICFTYLAHAQADLVCVTSRDPFELSPPVFECLFVCARETWAKRVLKPKQYSYQHMYGTKHHSKIKTRS